MLQKTVVLPGGSILHQLIQFRSSSYLQIKIFDLECKVNHYEELSKGNKDDEDDDTSNAAASHDEPCTISYCNCPCHKKKDPAPPAPPPAPPAMYGYCGEGSTQFATWGYGY